MKKKLDLKINQKLEVQPAGEQNWHSTVIQDMSGDIVFVAIPTNQKKPMIPQKGDQVGVRLVEGNALLLFETQYLGVKTGGAIPLLMLKRPLTFVRKQRRNYYRHPAVLIVEIAACGQADAVEWVSVKSLDIGGGGIKIASPVRLAKDAQMQIKLHLGDNEDPGRDIILVTGKVVREDPYPDNRYSYGICFTEIEETSRDRIINYIFNISRKRVF